MDDTRIQHEINKYKKFKKVDGATYRKVNQFLRKRTYITAREWALARLCTDFRTSGGAEMTFIGQNLPQLVPFMEDTYSPQAVNQARNSFKKKVRKASSTFFYGAMCGFFTTDELDDLLFEASEVARFLLEVEGTTLDIDEEIDIEDRITQVMRGVGEAAKTLLKARGEEIDLPDQMISHAPAPIESTVSTSPEEQNPVHHEDSLSAFGDKNRETHDPIPEPTHPELPEISAPIQTITPPEALNSPQEIVECDVTIPEEKTIPNDVKEGSPFWKTQSPAEQIQRPLQDNDEEQGASS
jgi:hypothetical protein